jgi:hypothetical protein
MTAVKGALAMNYVSFTQLDTRRRIIEEELRLVEARAAARRPEAQPRPRRRRSRLLAAVRGAAAA